MIFTPLPQSNKDPICSGIEAFQNSRPLPSEAYVITTWVIFGISCFLWTVATIFFIVARDEPRLRVVRPLFLSLLLCASHFIFSIGALVDLVIVPPMPCGVMAACYILGLAGYGVNYFIRLLIYVVESQFEANAEQFKMHVREGDDDPLIVMRSSHLQVKSQSMVATSCILSTSTSFARVVLGVRSLDRIQFEELALVKRMYGLMTFIVLSPPVIILIVIITVVPQYHECNGCSLFFEVVIGFCITLLLYAALSSRMLYIAWKKKFPDQQGLFEECWWILVPIVSSTFLFSVLLMIDPNEVEFNRTLSFSWLYMAAMFLYWWVSVGKQMLHVYRYHQKKTKARLAISSTAAAAEQPRNGANRGRRSSYNGRRATTTPMSSGTPNPLVSTSHSTNPHLPLHHNSTSSSSLASHGSLNSFCFSIFDFIEEMDHDDILKQEFTKFAISRYAVENLHFVNDVRAFKRFFYEKARTWKRQKAMFLFATYIKNNATMEVNISDGVRKETVVQIETNIAKDDLFGAFDGAVEDIANNVLREIWVEFEHERRRRESPAHHRTPKHSNLVHQLQGV